MEVSEHSGSWSGRSGGTPRSPGGRCRPGGPTPLRSKSPCMSLLTRPSTPTHLSAADGSRGNFIMSRMKNAGVVPNKVVVPLVGGAQRENRGGQACSRRALLTGHMTKNASVSVPPPLLDSPTVVWAPTSSVVSGARISTSLAWTLGLGTFSRLRVRGVLDEVQLVHRSDRRCPTSAVAVVAARDPVTVCEPPCGVLDLALLSPRVAVTCFLRVVYMPGQVLRTSFTSRGCGPASRRLVLLPTLGRTR